MEKNQDKMEEDNNNSNPNANIDFGPADLLQEFKSAVANYIKTSLNLPAEINAEELFPMIEAPKDLTKADLCVPMPRLFAFTKQKKLTYTQDAFAKALSPSTFTPDNLITSFTLSTADPVKEFGRTFLNFKINKIHLMSTLLPLIYRLQDKWGNSNIGANKTVVIEYSSPNIAKPFHAGHLRSAIIGNFLRNIHKALGYKVVGMNYLGDWGKQYGLLAIGYGKYGNEEQLVARPIRHLYDVYVAINKDGEIENLTDKVKTLESENNQLKKELAALKNPVSTEPAASTPAAATPATATPATTAAPAVAPSTEAAAPATGEKKEQANKKGNDKKNKKEQNKKEANNKNANNANNAKTNNAAATAKKPQAKKETENEYGDDGAMEEDKSKESGKSVHDKAREYFKRMEDGDKAALELWKRFRDLSIKEYIKLYDRLNVEFDVYDGESLQHDKTADVMQQLRDHNLLTTDQGAQVIDLTKEKLGHVVVQKKDGATLYISRDIAAAISRYNTYHFDKMIYVVGTPQSLHFQQLFAILGKLDYSWSKQCQHVNFGSILGMSTRKGTVKFLEEILEEAQKTMEQKIKSNSEKSGEIEDVHETADIVGMSTVIVQDLSARRIRDYEFSWDRCTRSEGDTGPYLQYAHARLMSIERKNEEAVDVKKVMGGGQNVEWERLVENEAGALVMKMVMYPEVLRQAAEGAEAVTLLGWMWELTHAISAAHRVLIVKGKEEELRKGRAVLLWCARITLMNAMKMLGLKPLERM
eukprot:TRINITY_DN5794_c0_g1_i1.p1 TRINITY_DN5794_c0_g1~~TRINITY_DN5794_c0_g1_i1.p1  ORF type:complete len:758 (+),score=247.44 TRINITY_DN5794_c0_g1_i1:56-2329(+)